MGYSKNSFEFSVAVAWAVAANYQAKLVGKQSQLWFALGNGSIKHLLLKIPGIANSKEIVAVNRKQGEQKHDKLCLIFYSTTWVMFFLYLFCQLNLWGMPRMEAYGNPLIVARMPNKECKGKNPLESIENIKYLKQIK